MSTKPSTNIEIAQAAKMQPIIPLAMEKAQIPNEALEPFGLH